MYQQALKLAPGWGSAWYNLSKVQEKLERYGDAIGSLRTFLQNSPHDPEARAAQDHIYELEAAQNMAKARAESPEGKAAALRRRFSGAQLRQSWMCVVKDGDGYFQRYCNDEDARGSHWYGGPQTGEIVVSLTGASKDVIQLQFGAGGALCIAAASYDGSSDVYFSKWYMCPTRDSPAVVIDNVSLNASYNGQKAVYTQVCGHDMSGACVPGAEPTRYYYVLGQ